MKKILFQNNLKSSKMCMVLSLSAPGLVTVACDCNANGPVNVSAVTSQRGHKIEISIALLLSPSSLAGPWCHYLKARCHTFHSGQLVTAQSVW